MPDPITTITIDTSQIDSFLLAFPKSGPQIVERELHGWLDDGLSYVEHKVIDRSPVNTGLFRGSVYSDVTVVDADVFRGAHAEGFVSSSDYEPKVWALEWGREPGGKMPPIEAIALWVKRKGLAGTYSVKTKKRQGGRAQRGKEDTSLAWAIAIHIARYGTKAIGMFQKAYEESKDYVEKTAGEAVDRILNYWSNIK